MQLPKKISRTRTENSLLPVIVFIHGGVFMYGASTEHRPFYFMDEDVIVVTLNYRLNSFGKLETLA